MDSLPPEVFLNIFARLSLTSLSIVKLVCRHWYKLARDPLLVNLLCSQMIDNDQCLILHCDYPVRNQIYAMHLYRHDENIGMVKNIQVPIMPEFDVISSCNGLLCLSNQINKKVFYVYNPLTNCYAELPPAMQNANNWTAFGFGFNSTTKEYKLVKIAKIVSQTRWRNHRVMPPSSVEILTLGSSAWRNLGHTSYFPISSSSQVLVNGRLHWVNWPRRYRPCRMLVSFDLADEQFQEVPQPDSVDLNRKRYELLVVGGCLSAAYCTSSDEWQVWIMKEYGVQESWINEFNIGNHIPRSLKNDIDPSFRTSKFYRRRSCVRVLCRLRNGEMLLNYMCRALVAYDPISRTFRGVQIQEMPNWFESIVHMSSLNWIDKL